MDFSASGGCHQSIHQVPRRSSVSSEHSSKVQFSGFFAAPAGARLFCLGMVALILTLPWNPPSAYAWNFTNDGIPTPPIVMGLDAPVASPPPLPSDGPLAAPHKVPPLPIRILISPSLPPISMTNLPSLTTGSPGPIPTTKKKKNLNWRATVGATVSTFILVSCLMGLLYWHIVIRHPLRIFISYGGSSNGNGKNFATFLCEKMKSKLKSHVKIFFDQNISREGVSFATTIIQELAKFDVGIVVVTEEYFEEKWPMIELLTFVEAQKKDPRNRICILPLFYRLTPQELKVHLDEGTWEGSWEEMAKGLHPIEVEKYKEAVKWLCNLRGFVYRLQRRDFDKDYIDIVCKEIEKIYKERSFASNLCWTMTTMRVTQMPLIGFEKKRNCVNQRARKENSLMTYINKRLQLLFAFSGLLNILLSVILDNFFNDLPIRFIAFGILAPLTIICGFLASGWFPQVPLRFIAFIKQCGFLQHVEPCSPWHDNVIRDYCGEVCHLEPFEQEEEIRLFEFPLLAQNFVYGNQIPLQGTTTIATTHSTFDSRTQDFEMTTLVQEGQDFQELNSTEIEMFDFAPLREFLPRSHFEMATSQGSLPNLHEEPSQVGSIFVDIDRSSLFRILDKEGVPTLEFNGPEINNFPLEVHIFKNTSTNDHTFDLSYTFRSKKTRKMYLTTERLQNLIQNMCRWMDHPYPIVVDEASNILHCMTIEDIIWEFTKTAYTLRPVHVEHRFLAGLKQIKFFIVVSFVFFSFLLSLIPLLSDKRSLFFLFFLFVVVPYLFALRKTNPLTFYTIRSLFCPICVKIFGFHRLYKSRSSFRWCNEFRKKEIVNPKQFWIDEEYANTCPDAASCFVVNEFLELPNIPPKGQSFTISCQSWPIGNPATLKKQHNYGLIVKFVAHRVIKDFECYTNVKLTFLDGIYLLGEKNYSSVEVRRIHLVEKLFHCFSDPSFGGYVEEICPRGYCSTTFVAHCPRFIDICNQICSSESIPKLLIASRLRDCKFIVGVPFWFPEL